MRGRKNPGCPIASVIQALARFVHSRMPLADCSKGHTARPATIAQNASSFPNRSCGALPAMIAPLIAPIDTPQTQSGSHFASDNAWYTPT